MGCGLRSQSSGTAIAIPMSETSKGLKPTGTETGMVRGNRARVGRTTCQLPNRMMRKPAIAPPALHSFCLIIASDFNSLNNTKAAKRLSKKTTTKAGSGSRKSRNDILTITSHRGAAQSVRCAGGTTPSCQNENMHRRSSPTSQSLTDLSVLIDDLPLLRSMVWRQQSQPWKPIPCGPSREPVSVHIKRFRSGWTSTLGVIASACPSAAHQCNRLLRLDPLRADSDAVIADAIAAIRRLSDPLTIRTMAREKERRSFGAELCRLRLERGLSLRKLASECAAAAKRLKIDTHTPLKYQIVAYEAGRLGAHHRTRIVIAASLGVSLTDL